MVFFASVDKWFLQAAALQASQGDGTFSHRSPSHAWALREACGTATGQWTGTSKSAWSMCSQGSQSTHEEANEKREVQALGHTSAPTCILSCAAGVLDVPLDVGGVSQQLCGV